MIKKLLTHSVLYGIAPQITKVVSVLVLPFLTKHLTPLDYAVTGILSSYSNMFGVLQTLGLPIVIGNSYYIYPKRYPFIWRQLLGFLTLQSIVYGIFISYLYFYLIPEEAAANKISIILLNVLPLILFGPTQNFVFRYYQKNGQPFPLMIRSLLVGLITVALNVYFIVVLKMGYMGWFWSSAIASFVGFAAFFYPFFIQKKITPIFNFKWRTIKKALKVSLPTIPHYYSTYLLNSSDRAVMDILKINTSKIGLYSFAYNFGTYFDTIATAMTNASSPMYMHAYRYKNKADADIFARNLTWLKQSILLLGTTFFCLWSKDIFEILVRNDELKNTYPIVIIIVMAFNYRPMYLGVMSRLIYHERTKSFWRISFFAGLINVALNLILIPILGFKVAAYTTFAAYMYMGYSGYYLREFKEFSSIDFKPILWLTITLVSTILVYILVELSLPLKFTVSLMLVSVLAYQLWKWRHKLN